MKEIRNTSKWYGNVMLQQKENGTYYVYYLGRTLLLKENVLKRANIFIIHSAIIEMEQEKFMKDLTHIGRWKNKGGRRLSFLIYKCEIITTSILLTWASKCSWHVGYDRLELENSFVRFVRWRN
ncbi:hypothetical protein [Bacillus wiedmannii]|uniref:hypothetical protein n=2 Tax=Bacillus wiedmannii TaxID=1890302 RepID=UPI0006D976D2|nr:hypothetical protein [Bacillus wiedmannii]KPU52239.1 hypothetical protein AN402_1512 [Bacillus wiedmannii]